MAAGNVRFEEYQALTIDELRERVGTGEIGTCYLICAEKPIGDLSNPRGQAKHYFGWARDLNSRIASHRNGTGSSMTQAFKACGVEWEVVRTWEGVDRWFERVMKRQNNIKRHCPRCNK